jgi:hypothetical protein
MQIPDLTFKEPKTVIAGDAKQSRITKKVWIASSLRFSQ